MAAYVMASSMHLLKLGEGPDWGYCAGGSRKGSCNVPRQNTASIHETKYLRIESAAKQKSQSATTAKDGILYDSFESHFRCKGRLSEVFAWLGQSLRASKGLDPFETLAESPDPRRRGTFSLACA